MQPSNRTPDIEQPSMQSITFSQIDCSHSRALSAIIALVVRLNGLVPECARLIAAVLAEADID